VTVLMKASTEDTPYGSGTVDHEAHGTTSASRAATGHREHRDDGPTAGSPAMTGFTPCGSGHVALGYPRTFGAIA